MRSPKPVEERDRSRWWWGDIEQAQVPCKHGKLFRCAKCGTGERDTRHSTRGGRGKVDALRSP
jgi:hypothetical protein